MNDLTIISSTKLIRHHALHNAGNVVRMRVTGTIVHRRLVDRLVRRVTRLPVSYIANTKIGDYELVRR